MFERADFVSHNILTLNERTVDVADISPATLSEILSMHRATLRDRLSMIDALDTTSERVTLSPHILIARLASKTMFDEFLTKEAIEAQSPVISTLKSLKKPAIEYVKAISTSEFVPEVHRIHIPTKALDGYWLAISARTPDYKSQQSR